MLLSFISIKTSEASDPNSCINCHAGVTPGIVEQWRNSKMSSHFSCDGCHTSKHAGMEDAEKAEIPTPKTCAKCHPGKVEEFREGKHSLAWIAMKAMPMIAHQPKPIVSEGFKGCAGCHKIGEKSEEELSTFRYGTGSCDSCHTRHKFSKEEAQNPRACQTCHMGFDHPQWEMWSSSKHGVIFAIEGDTGRAPKCQTCHMIEGDHAVMTAWGFLALRLPEEDEKWLADRIEILKALGVLDENGEPTERLEIVKAGKVARLTKEEFEREREKMIEICKKCHSESYARSQLEAADEIIKEIDYIFAEAIREVKSLYDAGILEKPEGWTYAPDLLQFYEARTPIEQDLYLIFLEYRMRAFQGAFHMNPDYMHWYGWAPAKETLVRIQDEAERLRAETLIEERAGLNVALVIVVSLMILYILWRRERR
ncbi:MAG: multiheme c-type cytochrome [Candidatus Methanofastidiosia archaeon]